MRLSCVAIKTRGSHENRSTCVGGRARPAGASGFCRNHFACRDELRAAISGKTVYLNVSGFELPIVYSANGRMKGTMGAVTASFSRGDGSSDRGKWWVENDQLCQKWTSWMDGVSRHQGDVGAQ